MARPFLADPELVKKAQEGREDEINTCIGCNQACLDHVFKNKLSSCLVNPRACHETIINYLPVNGGRKQIAVVGAGPAGLAFSVTAAGRGHKVTLYEADSEIGGQFNMAKTIPGKEEFNETIRYYGKQLGLTGVSLKLNTRFSEEQFVSGDYDEVILATGVKPRKPVIEGVELAMVLSYLDVLKYKRPVGKRVAIIGAGGIGFDVAEFLSIGNHQSQQVDEFLNEWGIDPSNEVRGGVDGLQQNMKESGREITMFQRSGGKMGAGLGKTTGWILRNKLKMKGVKMVTSVLYDKIDEKGLHYTIDRKSGREEKLLEVDNVILCTGQLSENSLYDVLRNQGISVQLVGGADKAEELDAKKAIEQASMAAATV